MGHNFGGTYILRGLCTGEICVSNSIGLACSGMEITIFALFYFVFEGNSKYKPPGGLIFGGAI